MTPAISILATIAVVLFCKIEWVTNRGIATIKPNAVVFIATDMDRDKSADFSAWSALATAENAAINPTMASQMFNMSMMMGGGADVGGSVGGVEGQPVPYELFRRLEMRVNQLELELNNLKLCLRSV